jgi:hypothetical protein
MTSQTFEILCPVCRSVVPPEAKGCPNCARTKMRERAMGGDTRAAAPVQTSVAPAAPQAPAVPDLHALPMKDYHRVVRATYQASEGTAPGSRFRAYLPFVLLLLLLVIGAAVISGHV